MTDINKQKKISFESRLIHKGRQTGELGIIQYNSSGWVRASLSSQIRGLTKPPIFTTRPVLKEPGCKLGKSPL